MRTDDRLNMTFWLILTILALVAGFAAVRRRSPASIEREPWEADPADDEPLDMEEIRRAEAEWEAEQDWEGPSEEEEWR